MSLPTATSINIRAPLPTWRSELDSSDTEAQGNAGVAEAALMPTTIAALDHLGVLRHWAANQVVASRGQPVSAALLLKKGRLRVSLITPEGGEQLLRWMLPGEISGLSSVFASSTYPADLVATRASQVLHVERNSLLQLIEHTPSVAVDFLRVLGLRVNQLMDTLADQSISNLTQRVWATLVRMAKLHGRAVPEGLALPLSQSDLALACCASRQRVNQQLQQLERMGQVRLGYRHIVLLRADKG